MTIRKGFIKYLLITKIIQPKINPLLIKMESSMDTLAELADRAQGRILKLDNELNLIRAVRDNLKKEISAIDIKLM